MSKQGMPDALPFALLVFPVLPEQFQKKLIDFFSSEIAVKQTITALCLF
ncbi:MAG: hypothetical protein ACK5NN_08335 [Sphingomonadaceae bacterium]